MRRQDLSSCAMIAKLELVNLRCAVYLGCLPGEQDNRQDVLVTLTLNFSRVPSGCETDDLAGVVNYADLAQVVRETTGRKKYALIEHLAEQIWTDLQNHREIPNSKVLVKVVKVRVPIEGLEGGASFSFGEQL